MLVALFGCTGAVATRGDPTLVISLYPKWSRGEQQKLGLLFIAHFFILKQFITKRFEIDGLSLDSSSYLIWMTSEEKTQSRIHPIS